MAGLGADGERVLLRLDDVPWMRTPYSVESVLAAHPETTGR